MAVSKAKRERQRANRREKGQLKHQLIMQNKIENKIGNKNEFGYYDLTPFNADCLIKGGKVADISLGDNHIYGSIHELGKRLPGSM